MDFSENLDLFTEFFDPLTRIWTHGYLKETKKLSFFDIFT